MSQEKKLLYLHDAIHNHERLFEIVGGMQEASNRPFIATSPMDVSIAAIRTLNGATARVQLYYSMLKNGLRCYSVLPKGAAQISRAHKYKKNLWVYAPRYDVDFSIPYGIQSQNRKALTPKIGAIMRTHFEDVVSATTPIKQLRLLDDIAIKSGSVRYFQKTVFSPSYLLGLAPQVFEDPKIDRPPAHLPTMSYLNTVDLMDCGASRVSMRHVLFESFDASRPNAKLLIEANTDAGVTTNETDSHWCLYNSGSVGTADVRVRLQGTAEPLNSVLDKAVHTKEQYLKWAETVSYYSGLCHMAFGVEEKKTANNLALPLSIDATNP